MKHRVQIPLSLLVSIFCFGLLANIAQATVSYWDPEGFRGSYNTYTGATPLSGFWETNVWSRNTDGSTGLPADQGQLISSLQAWPEGDAAVFAVGAGATNS